MHRLRISSGILLAKDFQSLYILEIICGLFSRLTHQISPNKTLQLINIFPQGFHERFLELSEILVKLHEISRRAACHRRNIIITDGFLKNA